MNLTAIRSFKLVLLISIILVTTTVSQAQLFGFSQSARVSGEGGWEIAPQFASFSYINDGSSTSVLKILGLANSIGVSTNTDIRISYERYWINGGEISEGGNFLMFGPKFSMKKDRSVFSLPIGNTFGNEGDDAWQIHPSFIFTFPLIKDQMDLSVEPKYILTFCEDCNDLFAFNFGLSAGELNKWGLRFGYGLMYGLGDANEGHYSQLSLGFFYKITKNNNEITD